MESFVGQRLGVEFEAARPPFFQARSLSLHPSGQSGCVRDDPRPKFSELSPSLDVWLGLKVDVGSFSYSQRCVRHVACTWTGKLLRGPSSEMIAGSMQYYTMRSLQAPPSRPHRAMWHICASSESVAASFLSSVAVHVRYCMRFSQLPCCKYQQVWSVSLSVRHSAHPLFAGLVFEPSHELFFFRT